MGIMAGVLLVLALMTPFAYFVLRTTGRNGLLIIAAIFAVAGVVSAPLNPQGKQFVSSITWIPQLGLNLTLRLDQLSWLMSLLVLFAAALVLVYSRNYFSATETGIARFGTFFVGFTVSMLGLVLSDNVYLLFIFWESTTVFSFLLIAHYYGRRTSRAAALQALIVTTAGGLAMLVGFVIFATITGSPNLSVITAEAPSGSAATLAIYLVLAGALSKSAIFPFHFWLPGAMAAPTPVSAFLHAAAMVKAGVYLVARLAIDFAHIVGVTETLVVLGAITMLLGGIRAMRQFDIKLIVAYGTVSQLGFMVMVIGIGDARALFAGITLMFAHALAKAPLFLTVGIIDHRAGTRDMRMLSGIGKKDPLLAAVAGAASLSMIGAPLFFGFLAKESVFSELYALGNERSIAAVAFVLAIAGSVLTVMYMMRFWWGSFATKPVLQQCEPTQSDPRTIVVAPAVFAFATLLFGVAAGFTNSLLQPIAPNSGAVTLALWHGITPALGATVLVFAVGVVLGLWFVRSSVMLPALPERYTASHIYWLITHWVDELSVWLTSLTQRGSLPFYLAVILSVFVSALGVPIIVTGQLPSQLVLTTSPAQLPIAIVMIVAALFAVRARTRFQALVLVGVTGYGMALIFGLHGAPDLALTQALVETITLIAFVLVIRRLPQHFVQVTSLGHRVIRAIIGAGVGLVFALLAVIALSSRTAEPISQFMPDLAYRGGHGNNVVNVMLVDMRGWDTLGELSVILAAATGVASLVFLRTRVDRAPKLTRRDAKARIREMQRHVDDPNTPNQRLAWMLAGRDISPARRSILLEVVVRLTFHLIMLVSFYLLLTGHNTPGGGFSAGLIAGLALVARYLAGGRDELGATIPVDAGRILGAGLALAATMALVPMFFGQAALSSSWIDLDLGALGTLPVVTSTLFDLGVYLVVFGLVLDVLRSLGAEVDRQEEQDNESALTSALDMAQSTSESTTPLTTTAQPKVSTEPTRSAGEA